MLTVVGGLSKSRPSFNPGVSGSPGVDRKHYFGGFVSALQTFSCSGSCASN